MQAVAEEERPFLQSRYIQISRLCNDPESLAHVRTPGSPRTSFEEEEEVLSSRSAC